MEIRTRKTELLGEIPPLLRLADGSPVTDAAAWEKKRGEILESAVGLPGAEDHIRGAWRTGPHSHDLRDFASLLDLRPRVRGKGAASGVRGDSPGAGGRTVTKKKTHGVSRVFFLFRSGIPNSRR